MEDLVKQLQGLNTKNSLSSLLKKSQLYLNLNLFHKSIQCSESFLKDAADDPNEEVHGLRASATELKIKALFGLGKYSESILYLGREIKLLKNLMAKLSPNLYPHNKKFLRTLIIFTERAKELMRQSETGDIDMGLLVPNKKVKLDVERIPEYQGPISIGVNIQGKGRGVLALKDIPKGSLVLVSRAFEIIFDTEDEDDDLENAIAQRMLLDGDLIPQVYKLHGGKELGYFDNELLSKDEMKIDIKRITGICTMNSFGNSRNSSGYGHNSRGLWLLPSFFNHDCIDVNCVWKVLGDFLFVRTCTDIRKGEELLIAYTDSAELFEEREKFFKAHDFSCVCRLCKFQSQEDPKIRKRRIEIISKLNELEEKKIQNLEEDIPQAENYLKELENLGEDKPEWNFIPHVALDLLCKLYLKKNDPKYMKIAARYYLVVNCSKRRKTEDNVLLLDEEERSACLEVGAAGQVAAVHMKGADYKGALEWIKVLKQDLCLVYGKCNVFAKLYPQVYAQAVNHGLNV